jgi:hypothetical protein
MSPTAKLRIPGHRVEAARLPDESRYGGNRGKNKRLSEEEWEKLCVRAGTSMGGEGGRGATHARTHAPLTCSILPAVNARVRQRRRNRLALSSVLRRQLVSYWLAFLSGLKSKKFSVLCSQFVAAGVGLYKTLRTSSCVLHT